MKKLAFYLAFITLSLNVQAQENQQKVKELEATIQNLQAQVESLNLDIEEYKKALNIKNAPYQMYGTIQFSIASAEGDENTGELIVTVKGYNKGPDSKAVFEGKIIDFDGNSYSSDYFHVTGDHEFYKDTPGLLKFKFEKVQNSPRKLNIIIGDYKTKLKFQDVSVTWK